MVALNSECDEVGGCGSGSPQERWLVADLAAHPARCTLAYWHKPLFSSGEHGGNTELTDIWTDLHRAGAELVLNGHDHNYERFAPQDPAGQPDAQRGIRQFVVGTGGKAGRGFGLPVANSETRNSGTRGVLRLELHPEGYDWRFAPWPGWTSPMRGRTNATEPRRYDRTAGLIVDDARLHPGRRRPPMDRRGVEGGR